VNKKMPENVPEYKGYQEDGNWHIRIKGFPADKENPFQLTINGNAVLTTEGDGGHVDQEVTCPYSQGERDRFLIRAPALDPDFQIEKDFVQGQGTYVSLALVDDAVSVNQQSKPW